MVSAAPCIKKKNGDCSANYPSMAETLRGGLSLACGGLGFWNHDMGGFEETAPADVYKRRCVFGVLSSQSRLQGSISYRVPWLFDEEACDVPSFSFEDTQFRAVPYCLRCNRETGEMTVWVKVSF